MKKSARFLIPLLVAGLMLAACGPTSTPQKPTTAPPATPVAPAATTPPQPTEAPTTPPAPKAITVQRGANDPRSIDPQRAVDARDATLVAHLFPSLVVMDAETNAIEPGIATRWEVSDDGLVYTFHLMEKVPWVRYNPDTQAVEQVKDENGNVRYVKASDFAYGFLRALDPEIASPAAYILAPYIVGGAEFNGSSTINRGLGSLGQSCHFRWSPAPFWRDIGRWWHFEAEQFQHCPAMISQTGGHSWCTPHPTASLTPTIRDVERQT
mgnify:CR=1 FL=1